MKVFSKISLVLMTLLVLIVISVLVYTNKNITPPPNVPVTQFSAEKAYEHVKYLVQKIGPRPAGSKSELKASQYIAYVLNQYGWKVREQPFSKVVVKEASVLQREQQVELINSQNIIAELPGTSPDTVVIGAHYDSATFNAPGAVDNASGVGALLELARVLSKDPHEETYQLIFFGAEEYGLVGSQFYTAQADLSAVKWMLNVDMIGTPLEIDVAGKKSAPPELIKQVAALAGESHMRFHVSRDSMIMTRESSQGGASDFSSFLDQGIPAVGIGIYGRPEGFFHRPEDRLEHVSLEELQKVGEFIHSLVKNIKLESQGPNVWDDLYLPFQLGKNILIIPSYVLRIFTFLTFILTCLILMKFMKKDFEKNKLTLKSIFGILGVTFLLSLIVVGISGLGEIFWCWFKQVQLVYYAYPTLFIAVRIGIAIGILIILANWLNKLPLARDPHRYWYLGTILLLGVSLILALIRIDLAFPFVFWLLCVDLQYFLPNIIILMIGPYFIYWMHFEILNSQQWISYYQSLHKYGVIFLGLYSLLIMPLLLAAMHLGMSKQKLTRKLLFLFQKPALVVTGVLILSLGLVPVYTESYPQTVTVREEWSGSRDGQVHIFSEERLPNQVVKDLNGQEGKSIYLPISDEKPPLSVDTTMSEKNRDSLRILDISYAFNYVSEPYLSSFKFESDLPFEIKTDEFLPMSKLPKILRLVGVKQPSGKYSLIIQRTPPQKNNIQMVVETKGFITCSFEALFPDLTPQIQIQNSLISVDYQIQYKESYSF